MLSIIFIGIVLVILSVFTHQLCLHGVSKANERVRLDRLYIPIGVLGCFIGHFTEIVIFAVAYNYIENNTGMGGIGGACDGSLFDCMYFSFSTYTTLGYGDIFPLGHLRLLTGIEAITGILMAAWSTSFLFFKMKDRTSPNHKKDRNSQTSLSTNNKS